MECVIDFFHVEPGECVGNRVASHLYETLKAFGLTSKLHATITDSGSDAVASSEKLSSLLGRDIAMESILKKSHQLRCASHTHQLAIKDALKIIGPTISKLRTCISLLRIGKVREHF